MNTTRITLLLQAQSVCNELYNELNNYTSDNSNDIELIGTLLDSLSNNLKLTFVIHLIYSVYYPNHQTS